MLTEFKKDSEWDMWSFLFEWLGKATDSSDCQFLVLHWCNFTRYVDYFQTQVIIASKLASIFINMLPSECSTSFYLGLSLFCHLLRLTEA